VAGDGDFLMNGQELATAAQYGCDLIVIVVATARTARSALPPRAGPYPGRVASTDLANPRISRRACRASARGAGEWKTTAAIWAWRWAEATKLRGCSV
jgi:acetolactate synthase-1/2/3 large subunit